LWQLINREIGKTPEIEEKLELKIGNKCISNPTEITDKLYTHFVSSAEELIKQKSNGTVYNLKINNVLFPYLFTL